MRIVLDAHQNVCVSAAIHSAGAEAHIECLLCLFSRLLTEVCFVFAGFCIFLY